MSKAYEQLGESEKGPVVGHTVMFYEPVEMFERIPFNNSLKEKSWVHLKASEGDLSTYMFLKKMQVGGLIKLLDTYVTADISIRKRNNKLNASTICDYLPQPLISWWKSVDVAVNGVAASVSHTDNLIVSNIFHIFLTEKNAKQDFYGCNMGWEDVPDKIKYLHSVMADDNLGNTRTPINANTAAKKRIDSIVNADPQYCIEKMLMLFFNSGDHYIPTNNT